MQSWLPTVTIVGLAVVAVLVWLYLRARRQDVFAALEKKRQQSGAKLVSRAEYVEPMERVPVVIALSNDTFFYENADLDASFDLDRIDEIEYDDELATGKSLAHGHRSLRLRSHGTTFEFVLAPNDCGKWMAALPPHRLGEPQMAAAQ